jgi:flagellum-specific peptidoglycan hydrolase FlgJ
MPFYNRLVAAAVAAMKQTGIPASVTIAQGMLESAKGTSKLATEANNFFGIKAQDGDGWKGPTITISTWEYIGGHNITVDAQFRKYPDMEASVLDHARFLLHPRYSKAFAVRDDYQAFCHEIAKAGYATDPEYPQKLINLIEGFQLAKYDEQC